jgi:glycosyltransferase involved in cell wall biosynthesis
MASLDIIIPAFNAAHCLEQTLDAIFRQAVPAQLSLGVVVVNNRSTDGTGGLIDRWADKGVRRIDCFDEQSRSSALNAGVAASNADYVLLLDADCRLVGSDCFSLLSEAMAQNVDAGFGYTTGASDNFWERYHRSLEAERISAGWQGFTTACCLIKRETFRAVGGFSAEYQHYGFEDRDFICRLRSNAGTDALKSLPELRAIHDDDTTVQSICKKMYVSGRYSSGIFRRNFPAEYLATGYARVDAATAPKHMLILLKILRPLTPVIARIAGYLSQYGNTPLAIGRPFVRLCSALRYFEGTVDRNSKK